MASEEWGDWVDYSGGRAGRAGEYVQHEWNAEFNILKAERDGYRVINRRTSERYLIKDFYPEVSPKYAKLLRYRIRKPKGLTILENILNELPQLEDA